MRIPLEFLGNNMCSQEKIIIGDKCRAFHKSERLASQKRFDYGHLERQPENMWERP